MRHLIALLGLAVLIAAVGCSGTPTKSQSTAPPSQGPGKDQPTPPALPNPPPIKH